MSSMSVVGMSPDGVILSRIGITVPHRVAVMIPAHNDQDAELLQALQQKRLFLLRGHIPPGSSFRGAVAPVVAPDAGATNQVVQDLRGQVEALQLELQAKKAEIAKLEALVPKQDIMSALEKMQRSLESLQAGGVVLGGSTAMNSGFLDEAPPMFIPVAKRDDIKADFEIKAQEGTSDLESAKGALKSMRQKK